MHTALHSIYRHNKLHRHAKALPGATPMPAVPQAGARSPVSAALRAPLSRSYAVADRAGDRAA